MQLIRAKKDGLDEDVVGNLDTGGGLNAHHIATVELEDLYMFMGRELEPLEEIPAGNILGMYVRISMKHTRYVRKNIMMFQVFLYNIICYQLNFNQDLWLV